MERMIDPYQTPSAEDPASAAVEVAKNEERVLVGPPCPSCGSTNTTSDSVLRSRPNLLAVMLFGWIFMLARGAFAMRNSLCMDCGETHRYKSLGSWIALLIFLGIIGLVVAGVLIDPGA